MSESTLRFTRRFRAVGLASSLTLVATLLGCAAGDSSEESYGGTPQDAAGDQGGSGGTGGTGALGGSGGVQDASVDGPDGSEIDASLDADASMTDGDLDGDVADGSDDAEDGEPDSCSSQVEICDGLDNNCNGDLDEGDPGGGDDCVVPNKQGVCAEGTTHCQNAEVRCIQDIPASAEICDGLDNNCDGVADNATTDTGDSCNTGLQGVCAAGTQQCDAGQVVCEQNLQASAEVCNGLDDNCDGVPDDGFGGSGNPCTVPGQLTNTPCAQGLTNCLGGQNGCTQTVFPDVESCDGKDNDCDGTIDNSSEVNNKVCSTGLPGQCAQGLTQCASGVLDCIPNVYPGSHLEVCNGLDDDCDGQVDNVANINLECATLFSNAQNVLEWACSTGACEVVGCAGAYEDCDHAPANGCEINPLINEIHCGACGKVCSTNHGSPTCDSGQCTIACNPGYGDCDDNVDTGCELPLTADIDNCGTCGHQCESYTGTPTCLAGLCSIACSAGLGNCDGDVINGCETNLTSDVLHCGTCGSVCSSFGGIPSCAAGGCAINCNPGAANCDSDVSDGCEVNLNGDITNCGTCGHVCSANNGTPTCNGGLCTITCASGFGDCDGDVANGCETNLNSNAANCGTCGSACDGTNGTPSCTGGTCGIGCASGYGNCDADPSNGCEVNLNTDPLHCSSCSSVCSTIGGVPSCGGGVCSITCDTGRDNCDADVSNGCETILGTNTSHCGACNHACSTNHGTPTCSGGSCLISCATGYGNCDSDVTNGCETNLNTDDDNCNTCGHVCDNTHGTPSCSSGACAISCASGYGNCDGDAANGCETNLNTDPIHCGSCPTACSTEHGTASCTSGACGISCEANWANCDGNVGNGCEVDLRNDEDHCGNCSTVCSASGGTPACNNGTCGITCSSGYGDCTSAPGCETNLNTNVSHCGGCGLACSTNNGTPSCSAGSCSIVCAAGFANCDGDVSNGCETNLTTDPDHCGSCAGACNETNGTASCSSSTCSIACASGYGNCDGNASNGCEIDFSSNTSHCGACGDACSTNHGAASCTGGDCGIACYTGYGDCDGNVANGCETNTNGSVLNCGGCGVVCNSTHGTATCSAGSCGIICAPGYANCDGNPSNGCEVNLLADPTHCGTCSTVCSSNNGTPSCSAGACAISCNSGYGNCDGNVLNGCETNLTTDPAHCGTCSTVCSSNNGTPYCSVGACGINCSSGYGNCDGNASNGCETNINTSVTNCGSCGNVCSSNNGTPSCGGGACGISCSAGYGNCDGSPANGCEINLTNNVSHCSACGFNCYDNAGPYATALQCVSAVCDITGCSGGYYDMDNNFVSGCECQADSVGNNCGAALDVGNISLNGSTSRSYNITPTNDEDWFRVSFTAANCAFNPRISLNDPSGLLRLQVRTTCAGSTPGGFATCSEGGNSSTGHTSWEFTYSTTCGFYQSIDPIPDDYQPFVAFDTDQILFVRVYSTDSSTTCLPYTINFAN